MSVDDNVSEDVFLQDLDPEIFNESGVYPEVEAYHLFLKNIKQEASKNLYFHGYSMDGVPENWGLKKEYLNVLSHNALRAVLRGIYNTIIPDPMRAVLNIDEQIAIELAAGRVKPLNDFNPSEWPDDAYSIIKLLDNFSYKDGSMSSFSRVADKRFPSNRGDREKRIKSLDFWVLDKFVESFKKPYDNNFYLLKGNPRIKDVKNQIITLYANQYDDAMKHNGEKIELFTRPLYR